MMRLDILVDGSNVLRHCLQPWVELHFGRPPALEKEHTLKPSVASSGGTGEMSEESLEFGIWRVGGVILGGKSCVMDALALQVAMGGCLPFLKHNSAVSGDGVKK